VRRYESTSSCGFAASADPTSAARIAARLFGGRPGNAGPAVRAIIRPKIAFCAITTATTKTTKTKPMRK